MLRGSRSSRSPIAALPASSRPALAWLAAIGVGRAISLVLIAEAVTRGIVAIIDGTDAWRGAIALGIGAVGIRALLEWLTQVVSRRAAVGAKESLRGQLAERVTARGGRDIPGGVGAITVLATKGLDDLDSYYARFLPALVAAATIPPVVLIRVLVADWVSAAVIVITIPLVPIFMILIGLHTEDRTQRAMDEIQRLSDHLVELARGLPVLVGLRRAAEQTRALRAIASSVHQRTMTTLRTVFLSSLALELISTISVAVVAVFIGLRLVNGSMPLGAGLLALVLAPECYLPLRQVGAAFHASEDGVEALERVNRIIDSPLPDLAWASGEIASPALVRVRDLTIRYEGRPEPVVEALSFDAPSGTVVALDGPSGSGKSSVLAAIAGLLGTTPEGQSVDGRITGIDPDRIAWVPQHPEPFAETVRDEIALALESDDEGQISGVLAEAGAAHLLDHAHAELSQGELRRVAMARALARIRRGAALLLLDEPTAHLDPETASIIHRVIEGLRGRVTIILVAHDATTRSLADHVFDVGSGLAISTNPTGIPARSTESGAPNPVLHRQMPARENVSGPISLRETLALPIDLIQPFRPRFAGAVLLGALAALASVALTSVSAWLIIRASEQPPILYLMVAIVGVRFFGIGRAVFRYVQRLWMHDAILGALTDVRVRVWEALAARGPAVRRMLHGEETLDLLIGDVDRLRDLAPRVLLPPLVGLVAGIVATVALWFILPEAGLLMLAGSIVSLGVAPGLAVWLDGSSRRDAVLARSALMRRFAALVASAADLRVNGIAGRAREEIAALDGKASALDRRSAWSLGLGSGIVTLASGATSLAMLAVGAPAVANGEISHGLMAVLVLTPLAMVEVYDDVVEAVQQWPALKTVVGRFAPLLDDAPVTRSVNMESHLPETIQSLEMEHLSARWPEAAAPAFEDVSAVVRRGQWLVVTGPSGSGKSTLLSVLMAFLRPESGRYLLGGGDTATVSADAIRARISWCPQEAHLFDSTLRGNLLLARPKDDPPTEAEMHHILHRVGLGDLLDRLPDGLDTRIGSRGTWLSGGERQRVAIARALLTRAEIILLDEPTAHLDRETADALLADLRRALADRIVVMVTHHAADIASDDRLLHLGGSGEVRDVVGAVQSANWRSPGW